MFLLYCLLFVLFYINIYKFIVGFPITNDNIYLSIFIMMAIYGDKSSLSLSDKLYTI